MAAGGEIIGDLPARGVAQPRQRHMRGEFAAFRLEPEPLEQALLFGLQLHQRPGLCGAATTARGLRPPNDDNPSRQSSNNCAAPGPTVRRSRAPAHRRCRR